ncbi:hypothetical protein M3175_07590 [Robertmurraya korlensis]|uniref:hypothetical protein n=1 Tax=Robertmurraya korlensis TaxID=519977 RepID=UPI00204015BD|nr:hypothetical protein [Robertmurraya korlensis]MCM3600589.1 hypothetical protein [Robertmurraya korlensis]
MDSEQLDDLYSQIKLTGSKAETLINDWIKNRVNKEDIIGLLGRRTQWYGKLIKELQDAVETASVPLNIPTKRDVASVAKLTIQNEDRLEDIQQKLAQIETTLQRLEAGMGTKPSPTNTPLKRASRRPLDRNERAQLVQENLARLSDALLNQSKLGE